MNLILICLIIFTIEDSVRKFYEDTFPQLVIFKDIIYPVILLFLLITSYNKKRPINRLHLTLIVPYCLFTIMYGFINKIDLKLYLVSLRNYAFYPLIALFPTLINGNKTDFSRTKLIFLIYSIIISSFSLIQYFVRIYNLSDNPLFYPYKVVEPVRTEGYEQFNIITSFFGVDGAAGIVLLLLLSVNLGIIYDKTSSKSIEILSIFSLVLNIISIILIGKRTPIILMIALLAISGKSFIIFIRNNLKIFLVIILFISSIIALKDYIEREKIEFYRSIPIEGKYRLLEYPYDWIINKEIDELIFGIGFGIKAQGSQHILGRELYTEKTPHESSLLKVLDEGGIIFLIIYLLFHITIYKTTHRYISRMQDSTNFNILKEVFIYCVLIHVWSLWHFGVAFTDKFLIVQWLFIGEVFRIYSIQKSQA